jgi:hypothetical protein
VSQAPLAARVAAQSVGAGPPLSQVGCKPTVRVGDWPFDAHLSTHQLLVPCHSSNAISAPPHFHCQAEKTLLLLLLLLPPHDTSSNGY